MHILPFIDWGGHRKNKDFWAVLGRIRISRGEIGVSWLRDGENKVIRPKTVVTLGEIPNISQKPGKMIIFPGKDKPLS